MYTIQYRSIVLVVFFFFHIWMYVINPPHRIKVTSPVLDRRDPRADLAPVPASWPVAVISVLGDDPLDDLSGRPPDRRRHPEADGRRHRHHGPRCGSQRRTRHR
jgi:hypothetical protein